MAQFKGNKLKETRSGKEEENTKAAKELVLEVSTGDPPTEVYPTAS
jgi:hypothetical protein